MTFKEGANMSDLNMKDLLQIVDGDTSSQLNETTTAGAFATASVPQGSLKKRFEEMESSDDITDNEDSEELEESFYKVFNNMMDRHQWMMQELNKAKDNMTPEDAELLNDLIIKFGEAEVKPSSAGAN